MVCGTSRDSTSVVGVRALFRAMGLIKWSSATPSVAARWKSLHSWSCFAIVKLDTSTSNRGWRDEYRERSSEHTADASIFRAYSDL
jgi:hypothetical protein